MARGPSIDGHIDLEIQNGDSTNVDNVQGSFGFLSHGRGYLHTEHLYYSLHFYNNTTWYLFCD